MRHGPALAGAAQPGRLRARSGSRRSTPRSSCDRTLQGSLQALRAKAARPDGRLQGLGLGPADGGPRPLQLRDERARRPGFWTARDLDVVRPYVERYFTDVPAMAGRVGEDALARVATLGYPSPVVEQATLDLTEAALARDGPEPGGAPRARRRRLRAGRGGALAGAVRSGGEASHASAPEGILDRSTTLERGTDDFRPIVRILVTDLFSGYRLGELQLCQPHRHGADDPQPGPAERRPHAVDGDVLRPACRRRPHHHRGHAAVRGGPGLPAHAGPAHRRAGRGLAGRRRRRARRGWRHLRPAHARRPDLAPAR